MTHKEFMELIPSIGTVMTVDAFCNLTFGSGELASDQFRRGMEARERIHNEVWNTPATVEPIDYSWSHATSDITHCEQAKS